MSLHNSQVAWLTKWGGVCQGKFATEIPPNMFVDTLNYHIISNGALAPRPGVKTLIRTPDYLPPIRIYPIDWDGVLVIFVATSEHVYKVTFSSTEIPEITLIHTWTSECELASFAAINVNTSPHIVFGNGLDNMLKYDGENVTEITASSAPKGLPIAYKNYLAVYGIYGHPGRLQFNIENGDPDNWEYGGIPRTLELQGKVTALYPFGGLLIFTDNRTELFSGDPDQVEGQVVLSDAVGCPRSDAICEAEGMLFWLSYSGVSYWNGSGMFPTGILSDAEGERLSNISEDIQNINWREKQKFSISYDSVTRNLFVAVKIINPNRSEDLFRIYAYDMKYLAWFIWDLEAYKTAVAISPTSSKTYILFGAADGSITFFEPQSKSTDCIDASETEEREWDFYAQSGSTAFGTTDADKVVRAITLRIKPNTGTEGERTVNISLFGDFTDSQMRAVFDIRFGFILGIGQLGDRLEGVGDIEQRKPTAIKSKYFSWKVYGKGNSDFLPIHAIGLSYRLHSNRQTMTWNLDT